LTLTLAEALRRVETRCAPATASKLVPLAQAQARILADDIVAPISVPASDNSAVDGYGFRHGDLEIAKDQGLLVVGVSAAGRPSVRDVAAGEAIRIFTGAIPPPGVDTIAMQEDVARSGDHVTVRADIPLHANIRRAREDIAQGSVVMCAGRRIEAIELGVLASLGITKIAVRRKLRVAVLSTGDELVEPGEARGAGAIFDANRPTLVGMLNRLGCEVTDLGILRDDRPRLAETLASAAREHDAILTSAGVSAGDEDHIRSIVDSLGGLDFHSVAIKPGRPIAVGHLAGVPFFGMPGNPVAMAISFLFIVRPALLRLAGAAPKPILRFPVRADFAMTKRAGRREFVRCSLAARGDGLYARKSLRDGAGVLSTLLDADGLLELDEAMTDIQPGEALPFIPFSEFGL